MNPAEKQIQDLEQELRRVDNYSQLIDLQNRLIERGDTGDLSRLLDRKDRILARLARVREEIDLRNGSSGEEKNSARLGELRKELSARLEEFAVREKESLAKALALREWLGSQLRHVRDGKKMLRNYSPSGKAGKARFKDIKT